MPAGHANKPGAIAEATAEPPGLPEVAALIRDPRDKVLDSRHVVPDFQSGMKLSFLTPRVELRPYIRCIWVFESNDGLPVSDISMAAPNGCPKLVVNFENSLISSARGQSNETREQSVSFVGIRDIPVVLSTPARRTCFVGMEFHPPGVFPIFGIPMGELTNRLSPAEDLSGAWDRSFADRIWNHEGTRGKVDLIQGRLIQALRRGRPRNPLVEYCVDYLLRTNGVAAISDLEDKTGYGKRSLELLFKKYVGVSPKTLAGIFRFQWLYRKFARGQSYEAVKKDLYELFYDQSHFTNEFRKMTGFSPRHYSLKVRNEFGRRLTLA
jgi:AraC-like DNA-binding protein